MTLLLVALGAAVGAPLRYLTDRFVQARHDSWLRRRWPSRTIRLLPWGTFAVNIGGSFVLGAIAAAQLDGRLAALLGAGLCGGLTTYSTFGYETVRLVEEGAYIHAFVNVSASISAGLAAALGGAAVVIALT